MSEERPLTNVEAARLITTAGAVNDWRVLPEILSNTQSLRFQFENGLTVGWDPMEEQFYSFSNAKLAADWKAWKESKE